ncbi:MAG: hypothetical protein R3348_02445 [Xanthomonadales bacterium]|nr:hypothetical protein [Xanthomonadales bacterium]
MISKFQNWIPLLTAALFVSACGGTSQVMVPGGFPEVVFQPRPIKAAIVYEPSFRTYNAAPVEGVDIDIGSAQVEALTQAFEGLFQQVTTHSSRDEVPENAELVITPSVLEVQLSTPSDSYLNVYEVWIKFNLDIETPDGVAIDSWFMPAYGKTPDSFMTSRTEAIEEATVVALRDAGAKMILDFFRIPSVYSWMEREQKL